MQLGIYVSHACDVYTWIIVYCLCIYRSILRIAVSLFCFFFQAEDGIRDLVRSRGLGDVYKRQDQERALGEAARLSGYTTTVESVAYDGDGTVTVSVLSLIHI